MAIHRIPSGKRKSRLTKPAKERIVSIFKGKPLFPVMTLCLCCGATRFASVRIRDLRTLECPRCHGRKSFSAFVPMEYFKALMDEYERD